MKKSALVVIMMSISMLFISCEKNEITYPETKDFEVIFMKDYPYEITQIGVSVYLKTEGAEKELLYRSTAVPLNKEGNAKFNFSVSSPQEGSYIQILYTSKLLYRINNQTHTERKVGEKVVTLKEDALKSSRILMYKP